MSAVLFLQYSAVPRSESTESILTNAKQKNKKHFLYLFFCCKISHLKTSWFNHRTRNGFYFSLVREFGGEFWFSAQSGLEGLGCNGSHI